MVVTDTRYFAVGASGTRVRGAGRRTFSRARCDPGVLPVRKPWEVVQLARHPDRPTTLDYVAHLRIQVEHPVSEMVTGVDLAREQSTPPTSSAGCSRR